MAGNRIGGRRLYSYTIAGLPVESEIALPGLGLELAANRQPEVTIARGDVPISLYHADAGGPTWQIASGKFLLRIPKLARFLLSGGSRIVFELEHGAAAEDVAIFLIGTVFGILLHQRGEIVLHGSAVQVGGRAVLFCGASGAGKSTLAAALGQQGYALVTDDVCSITLTDGQIPMVQSDGRQLKLWDQAITKLGLTEWRGASVQRRFEKFYVEPGGAAGAPLPLGAVYVLREARPPHAPGIERPNVVDRALLLQHNAYRPLLVRRLGQQSDYFHAAARMADAAGIFHLTRVFDFAKMPEVIGWLERHWTEIGLTGAM